MRKITKLIYIMWFSFALGQSEASNHIPSDERGDPNYRRDTNIDINRVRATVFNYGITGRTGADPSQYPFEWPVNSGKMYIAMTALAVGAEVANEDSTLKPLVTIPFRSDQSGNSKAWQPVPSYLNPDSENLSKSDDEDTWPMEWPDKMGDETDPGWSGSWNGYFGKNQFNAEQEIYYKISDDRNFESGTTYIPDTTDLDRQGAGLLTGVRIMEWNQILIEDVVFILHEVKNDGTKDLDKVAFSLWLADLVGGDGDSSDDTPDFDLIYDVAWSMDADGIGNLAFGGDPVGVAATSFIETPGNNIDRIDNDGDGESNGPIITEEMITGEELGNAIDDNGNGLIDENMTHIPFGDQVGVTYADRIDNNGNAEEYSPVVKQGMIDSAGGTWGIWPPTFTIIDSVATIIPGELICDDYTGLNDDDCNDQIEGDYCNDGNNICEMVGEQIVFIYFEKKIIHLIGLGDENIEKAFADGIDNNESEDYPFGTGAEFDSPVIDSSIVLLAGNDPYKRFAVPGTDIILYDVGWEDLGLRYADGIDNDGDGAIDEGIDEGIDEMIDESRDDFIDNDYDWDWTKDDVGLYGDGSGGTNAGSYDQKPTSGSGSGFPGEPNIDKTDVSESDQMGLTSVGYDPAGSIPINTSTTMWNSYMKPGNYWDGVIVSPDNDLFVTSGYFPLKSGQTERISMAICLGNDQSDALRNKTNAQTAYDFDYRFAKSPNPPNVTVVPGDGKVTLYWDSSAENSYDAFMDEIGGDPYDFEGYKIYRATDWEFNDAYKITDGDGNPTFFKPYEQNGQPARWDKIDGRTGWHHLDLNGAQFYLGDDTGLQHSYVDHDVVNGQTYYYAVVAYDFGGDETNNIIPSDSPMRIRLNSLTGGLEMGPNVVEALPTQPSSGYIPGHIEDNFINHISGTSTGSVFYEVINPAQIIDEQNYRITFTDTLLPKNPDNMQSYDTLTTQFWYLENIITGDTLVKPEFLIIDSLYTFEPFIDLGNGIWDAGEPLVDIDNDGVWDDAEQYEVMDGNIIQFTDENGNGVWDDAEQFTDLGNGIWDPAEEGDTYIDLDGNEICGLNDTDENGDGFCDGEGCSDTNGNGECDPDDYVYWQQIYDGICNCPEPYNDLNDNGLFEPLNDLNGNNQPDPEEEYIDLNENGTWDAIILETIVDTVIYLNPLPEHNDYLVTDGFRVQFQNEDNISFDEESSFWGLNTTINSDLICDDYTGINDFDCIDQNDGEYCNDGNNICIIDSLDSLWNFDVRTYVSSQGQGAALPNDYRIIFLEEQTYESECYCFSSVGGDPCALDIPTLCQTTYFSSKPTNFKIQKQVSNPENENMIWEDIPFAFGDFSPYDSTDFLSYPDGIFNADWREQDWIIFLDHTDENGEPSASWLFRLAYPGSNAPQSLCCNEPGSGDTAFVFIKKPFLKEDIYEFTTISSRIDPIKANQDRWESNIKVVPNPYFSASAFEQKNTFSSGRGPREIQFRNLPSECTIRIYNIAGELVRDIHHDHSGSIENGSESWDLLSRDNLSVSYGMYIYHVDAPELGEHVGKFAIIK
tara:strand:- start:3707 stop:8335 length:4629 start_codon:yes stop_codon:yes gene_type:complete